MSASFSANSLQLMLSLLASMKRSVCQPRALLCWCATIVAMLVFSGQAQAQVNDATFVSQNVPSAMIAGQSYNVSVTMQNTGSTTWTAAEGYKLGAQNPRDNYTWMAVNRVSLGTTVAPGQQYTFNFTVKAPAATGTYDFQWKIVQEYVEWFGEASSNVAVTVGTPPALANNASFVSQSVVASMTPGSSYDVSVTMKNTGSTTWTAAEGYKLGAHNPGDNYTWMTVNRVSLGTTVAPGQQYTFNFTVKAPTTAGPYDFQWKMVKEYVAWFGEASSNVAVTVGASPPMVNNASLVSQNVVTSMTPGASYNVSVTMKNTGSTTWTAAEGYRLGAQNPGDNYTWMTVNRVMLGTSVAPGQQYTFNFSVKAPAAAANYNFQWKMVKEYVAWFGTPSNNVGVAVGSPAAGETITFFHNDASGSPMVATNASGDVLWKETYRPYGDRLKNQAASLNNKLWFAGKPYDDNTGLSYMGARYYDPLLGRFVGIDPADFDPGNIHSFNRYAYANNNPYKFVDPDGHSPIDVAFLVFDIGKLGMAMYTGVGVGGALIDVGASIVGVASPIPFAGQALKAARAAEKGVEIARVTERAIDAGRKAEVAAKGGTYALKDAEGAVARTGRTNDLARRRIEHGRNPQTKDLTFEAQHRTDVLSEQRGLEQMLHDQHNPPLNAINPISPTNPRLQEYLDSARDFQGLGR